MQKKTYTLLSYLLGLVIVATTSYNIYQTVKIEQQLNNQASKCISLLIAQGVERKDITTKEGICIVQENIYYTSLND